MMNHQPHSHSLFFFCLFSFLSLLSPALAKCHPDDESALLAFKSGIISDPSGLLQSWKSGTDCCAWYGISCQAANGTRVNSITLYGNPAKPNGYLSGTISPKLAKLKFLDSIYLTDLQKISGRFPGSLFKLPDLVLVYIENNSLSGPLPRSIGNLTRLQALGLQDNKFTGTIPDSIAKLTQLSQLRLARNSLVGRIPDGIRTLQSLTQLSLEENQLSGYIPDVFSSLSNLRVLNLSHNGLSGKIPATISSLAPNLAYLDLSHNNLAGQIPDFLGKFTTLDTLSLSSNQFTGVVPRTFSNLTKIFTLDLSRNRLVDPFPELYVKGIESLDLSYNGFRLGEIPKWVTSSPIITSLKLAGCGIKINLDEWKPQETYFFDYIDLLDNEITGSPLGILNRTDYLIGFRAAGNQLKFRMESLRIVSTLKYLDLSRNLVYGQIPAAIAGLQELNVSHNHLCGRIPASKFPASAFIGNDCLCGSPLSPCK